MGHSTTAETSCWYGKLIGKHFHIYKSVTRRATLAFIGSWVSPVGNNPTLELLNAVLCVLACCYHTIYAGQVCSGLFRPFTLKTNTACGWDREWTWNCKDTGCKTNDELKGSEERSCGVRRLLSVGPSLRATTFMYMWSFDPSLQRVDSLIRFAQSKFKHIIWVEISNIVYWELVERVLLHHYC